jgi:hypothetical protein
MRNMTPEESMFMAEFVRAEMSDGEAFVRSGALASLCARWRVEAARLENSMAERANALRECAAALEAEMAGSEANSKFNEPESHK